MRRSLALLALCLPAASALAQDEGAPPVEVEVVGGQNSQLTVAVPAMPGQAIGRGIAEVIASDLRATGAITPIGPGGIGTYGQAQAASPAYSEWRGAGAGALVSGCTAGFCVTVVATVGPASSVPKTLVDWFEPSR